MLTAASAWRTWRALRSGSEKTATVSMPSSRQVRCTRRAISPRLASSTRLNILLAASMGVCARHVARTAVGARECRGVRVAWGARGGNMPRQRYYLSGALALAGAALRAGLRHSAAGEGAVGERDEERGEAGEREEHELLEAIGE